MSEDFLVTVRLPAGSLPGITRQGVASVLGISETALSEEFGVVPVDPDEGLVSVMISDDAFRALGETAKSRIEGPFANPKIAPFGPPQ